MRVLFIENRYKTYFWEKIAELYTSLGVECFFLVQNHAFVPNWDKNHVKIIPYPKSAYTQKERKELPEIITKSHRGLNYFGLKSKDHVHYYYDQFQEQIDHIKPNLVFGESTLFHEIIAIQLCKDREIPYLHPSTCRYPPGRFSFYQYDSLDPVILKKTAISKEKILKIIDGIIKRNLKIDYMVNPIYISKLEKLKDKITIATEFLKGERYNTPAPHIKWKLEKQKKTFIAKWDNISEDNLKRLKGKTNILYPLQLQPEANIDVWGYPNNDQYEVIQKIHRELNKDCLLILKPNPKSKYEIDDRILDFIKKNENVISLRHSILMSEIFHLVHMIVTVTGTVAIEAALSQKPCIILGDSLLSKMDYFKPFRDFNSVKPTLKLIQEQSFQPLDKTSKILYFEKVMETSWPGIIGDGLHNKHYILDAKNMEIVNEAFLYIKKIYLDEAV